jgi:membrane-associated protease RseP (regulator of RpoE activity)
VNGQSAAKVSFGVVNALGIVLFVVALLTSIVLHEAGHMVCARWSGGKVTEFFVGFGPRLWSFRRGGTEYGVKAIPAGGYVKIVGMTELEEIEPEDEPYALYHKPARWRLLTLSAGSITHFIIGVLLFLLIPLAFGELTQDLTGTVGSVSACYSTTKAAGTCNPATDPASPAAKAGLRAGDKIVAVNGATASSWNDVVNQLHTLKSGTTYQLTYVRGGARHTVSITPVTGNVAESGPVSLSTMIGITAPNAVTIHPGLVTSLDDGFRMFGSAVVNSVRGIGQIPGDIPKLFDSTVNHAARSDTSPVGVVGMAQVGGQVFGQHQFSEYLAIIAAINVFIGLFNLLPILPLDGGHIAVLIYEVARRRVLRLFGRADPGRVDLNKLLPIAYMFLILFVGLTVLLLAADISNPIKVPG